MARHLTMEEREIISQMRYARRKQVAIANRLGRSKSTISRELARNRDSRGYSAVRAQRKANKRRRQRPLARKMDQPKLREQVCRGLAKGWSPDQIAGRLRRDNRSKTSCPVSHQTIYTWISRQPDRSRWKACLRFGGKRRRRRDGRGKIPRAVHIDRRPAVVDHRSRYGDWEGDTIVGARRRGGLVTHVERKSGYLLSDKLTTRLSAEVNRVSLQLFQPLPVKLRRTLTLDNGKEFAGHEDLSRWTGIAIYFAKPYSAWQRGTNENTNGLLRQYFPKGTNFEQVSAKQLQEVVALLNDRPRKRLKYRTPREVFLHSPHVAFEN